ncbi:MAG: DUF2076 domain-containing protein [Geminicoccaceae bacterium]
MDQRERQIIDDLFGKLRTVDAQTTRRDPEAEQVIADHLARLPAAPYYMAQAIHVQEQALSAAQARVQELERQLAEAPTGGGGGFLSSLFGGAPQQPAPQQPAPQRQVPPPVPTSPPPVAARGPWGGGMQSGGFLAGAMQTAMGVAGGMLVADAISSAFHAGTANAAEVVVPEVVDEVVPADDYAQDDQRRFDDDLGGDSDMDFDDSI